jgi:hypothetical protein
VGAPPLLVGADHLDQDLDAGAIGAHRQTMRPVLVRDRTPFLVGDDVLDVLLQLRPRVWGSVEVDPDRLASR